MGPGFDTLGLALNLYNTVTVSFQDGYLEDKPAGMVLETVEHYRKVCAIEMEVDWSKVQVSISGDIPISRGLGSSVSVRLGILLGLAELTHSLGLAAAESRESVLDWVIHLEGHPDNAVASCLGGLGVCSRRPGGGFGYSRVEVGPELQWVALVPDLKLSTEEARRLLPQSIPLTQAVENMQNTARLAVALALGRYKELPYLFKDNIHQPYRQALIPGFQDILLAATDAGALGSFLSGAGSCLMAVVHRESLKSKAVAEAMLIEAQKYGLSAGTLILEADNHGARVV
jgi:homoserine kinase